MIRWLLDVDEQSHAHHVDDVSPHDKNPLSVSSHRNDDSSIKPQTNVDGQGNSEPLGTLSLYDQGEFYSDMPRVVNNFRQTLVFLHIFTYYLPNTILRHYMENISNTSVSELQYGRYWLCVCSQTVRAQNAQ